MVNGLLRHIEVPISSLGSPFVPVPITRLLPGSDHEYDGFLLLQPQDTPSLRPVYLFCVLTIQTTGIHFLLRIPPLSFAALSPSYPYVVDFGPHVL